MCRWFDRRAIFCIHVRARPAVHLAEGKKKKEKKKRRKAEENVLAMKALQPYLCHLNLQTAFFRIN